MHTHVLTKISRMFEVIVGMCSPAAWFWLGSTTGEAFSHTALSHECEAALGL